MMGSMAQAHDPDMSCYMIFGYVQPWSSITKNATSDGGFVVGVGKPISGQGFIVGALPSVELTYTRFYGNNNLLDFFTILYMQRYFFALQYFFGLGLGGTFMTERFGNQLSTRFSLAAQFTIGYMLATYWMMELYYLYNSPFGAFDTHRFGLKVGYRF